MLFMPRVSKWIGLAAIALIGLGIMTGRTRGAQQDVVVRCRFETSSIEIGTETVIYLEVLDVVDFDAYRLGMSFDADLVQVYGSAGTPLDESMTLGNFLSPDLVFYNTIDNDSGMISIGVTQFPPSPPQNGSGVLALGYVLGLDDGTADFLFDQVELLNSAGVPIPHLTDNCSLAVGSAGQATETPTATLNPLASPTATPTSTATATTVPTPNGTPDPPGTKQILLPLVLNNH